MSRRLSDDPPVMFTVKLDADVAEAIALEAASAGTPKSHVLREHLARSLRQGAVTEAKYVPIADAEVAIDRDSGSIRVAPKEAD